MTLSTGAPDRARRSEKITPFEAPPPVHRAYLIVGLALADRAGEIVWKAEATLGWERTLSKRAEVGHHIIGTGHRKSARY